MPPLHNTCKVWSYRTLAVFFRFLLCISEKDQNKLSIIEYNQTSPTINHVISAIYCMQNPRIICQTAHPEWHLKCNPISMYAHVVTMTCVSMGWGLWAMKHGSTRGSRQMSALNTHNIRMES